MKELIIKCGAAGDVVRTTPLLRVLNSEIWWVTSSLNIELLQVNIPNLTRVISLENAQDVLKGERFDRVISMDDELDCASLATWVDANNIFGSYISQSGVVYSPEAEPWFGMGLLANDGIKQANKRKWDNVLSYQEILFKMLGEEFCGEEYLLPENDPEPDPMLVAIEPRAGARWPTKVWNNYRQLAAILRYNGFKVRVLSQRPTIIDYLNDIAGCGHLICGDTLAMHLGLGLGIKVTAIFTCTAPQEIYSYNRMQKVVSTRIEEAFYVRDYLPEVIDAITPDMVFEKFMRQIEDDA